MSDPWQVRLFVSVDLAGSTALKQSAPPVQDDAHWQFVFEDFYKEFPAAVQRQYADIPGYCDGEGFRGGEKLSVWKVQGDEILFESLLQRHEQAINHVYAVKAAVREYNVTLAANRKPIRCKPTAWIAGFPVANNVVEVSTGKDDRTIREYIGSSIDTGFRLTKLASERRFAISIELALLLADAWIKVTGTTETTDPGLSIYFDGLRPLEGVLRGRPYPVIWIDMLDGTAPIEEELEGRKRDCCNLTRLKQFCHKFFSEHGLVRPFIDGDGDPAYKEIPPEIAERRKELDEIRKRRTAMEAQTGTSAEQLEGNQERMEDVGDIPRLDRPPN